MSRKLRNYMQELKDEDIEDKTTYSARDRQKTKTIEEQKIAQKRWMHRGTATCRRGRWSGTGQNTGNETKPGQGAENCYGVPKQLIFE